MHSKPAAPPNQPMTSRQRWFAALAFAPVDRLPFWPKLDGAYARAQQPPFNTMSTEALHQYLGTDLHSGLPGCLKETRQTTSVETTTQDGVSRTIYHTPHGTMESVRHFDQASQAWHPIRFPIQDRHDIPRMIAVYHDASTHLDPDLRAKSELERKRLGERALTMEVIGESPLMLWVEWLAGVEQAQYLLADAPDQVAELFAAIHRHLLERTRLLAQHSPADVLYLIENTSTTLISPDQYRHYCVPHITAYARLSQAANKPLILHMCGHLKALLPDLAALPVQAFEAFTSPSVGNTTLLDGRTHCPDKGLIGGTNATLWLQPADQIIARLQHDLDALPHHRGLVITSGGVMPPACPPRTIQAVADWLRHYPLRSV